MEKIRIITDSASDIPNNDSIPANLSIMPLTIFFGEEEYLDGKTITNEEYYNKLTGGDILPKTSQVTPYDFEQEIQKAIDNGEKVIVITLSSGLSGTYQSACIAASNFDKDVAVIDSFMATVSEQILVKYALQLIEQGMEYDKIVETLENDKKKIKLVGPLDTLEYLKKGGRISAAAAVFGSALSIKPIITVIEGKVEVIAKARGRRNAIETTLKIVRESETGIDFDKPYAVGYSGNDKDMLNIFIESSKTNGNINIENWPVVSIGSTIGTYTGPDSIIFGYFEK
ncbi:MAG: DegV family protein [Lachnospiraceae bacterium]|jgi:DegV family protein with EDD domain|nr:DegV family protein [Lachnospiraceae bacterium]MCR4866406.1 DegV family protein [Lachnospiraceae bacterium]